jgi:hypothetical protein
MDNLTEFQQRASAVAVVKMLSGKSFSICDLDRIADTMGRKQAMAGKDYAALHSLHCVDWADMGPELAAMVREKCFDLLGLPQAAIDSVCTKEAPTEKAHEPAKRLRLAFWK